MFLQADMYTLQNIGKGGPQITHKRVKIVKVGNGFESPIFGKSLPLVPLSVFTYFSSNIKEKIYG